MKLRVAVALCAVGAQPVWAEMCFPAPGYPLRWPQQLEFIGVASADTVEAGVGAMQLHDERGRPIRSSRRRVFGQIVRVDRMGTGGLTALKAQLSQGSRDVVLVPWSDNGRCSTTFHRGSARWLAPGTRALFWVVPRDPKHWVGGRPTFDMDPMGYGAYVGPTTESAAADSMLTPDELLTFSDALPSRDTGTPTDTTHRELEPLRRWMREHPDLAGRDPARTQISMAFNEAEQRRVSSIEPELAGTYRFHLVLLSGDSVTVFARTKRRASDMFFAGRDRDRYPQYDSPIVRSHGFYLEAALATRTSAFSARRGPENSEATETGWLTVVEQPESISMDSTVWRGGAHVMMSWRLTRDRSLMRQLRATEAQGYEIAGLGVNVNTFGRFVRYADGRVRFESDREHAMPFRSIRGERIASTTLPDR
jgi:hypothetical protein